MLDVSQEMSNLTLEIVLRCMFGQQPWAESVAIGAAVREAQEWESGRFWSVLPDWTERLPTKANRRFRRARAALDETVGSGIIRCEKHHAFACSTWRPNNHHWTV